MRAVFSLAIYTGLRRAEIWGLRWEHVEFGEHDPHVRVRFSYADDCKSVESVREVSLLPYARRALKAYWHTLNPRPITGVVFPADGGGCHSDHYDCMWRHKTYVAGMDAHGKPVRKTTPGWRDKAGVRREVQFRDLRHTNGVHLISSTYLGNDQPLSLEQLKEVLGHSSIKVTERHYAYLLPGSVRDAMHGVKEEVERGKSK